MIYSLRFYIGMGYWNETISITMTFVCNKNSGWNGVWELEFKNYILKILICNKISIDFLLITKTSITAVLLYISLIVTQLYIASLSTSLHG